MNEGVLYSSPQEQGLLHGSVNSLLACEFILFYEVYRTFREL